MLLSYNVCIISELCLILLICLLSGAVKITPAHDPKDYDVGEKHGLPLVNILTEDGMLTSVPDPFQVMPSDN